MRWGAPVTKTGDNRRMRLLGSLFALALLASPARGDVLTISGDAHGGGMFGTGTNGALKDEAFFARVPNATYGVAASARFFFLGGTIQHHQYVGPRINTDGAGEKPSLATWTQITAGLDFTVDLGTDQQKKLKQGNFIQVAAGAGFGVGTGQQVNPPLNNEQIDDKAFLIEGKFAFGKHIGKHWDFGLMIPVSYGYYFKNGVPANMLDNHYQGIHVEALAFLRLRIKIL